VDENAGPSVVVQFYRWDRENDLDPSVAQDNFRLFDHSYGDEIDGLLDELVGGAGRLDRTADWPTGTLQDVAATVVLHEDGPTFQFILEQLPAFVGAATSVFSAWVAWRSTRPRAATDPEPRRRGARIEIGDHQYFGPASDTEELQSVVRTLAAMTSEGDSGRSR
jgi:hypothetical protein